MSDDEKAKAKESFVSKAKKFMNKKNATQNGMNEKSDQSTDQANAASSKKDKKGKGKLLPNGRPFDSPR